MFEIKGFVFITIMDGHVERIPINSGFYVNNWQEAHDLLKGNEIERYVFTLRKVK